MATSFFGFDDEGKREEDNVASPKSDGSFFGFSEPTSAIDSSIKDGEGVIDEPAVVARPNLPEAEKPFDEVLQMAREWDEVNSDSIEDPIPSIFEGAKETYNIAERTMEMGKIGTRMKLGTATKADFERLTEIEKMNKEAAEGLKDQPFVVEAMSNLAPYMVESAIKGGKGALVGGMIGGSLAAIVGNVGPQAALPEELATVPAGTTIGAKIGASFNSVENIAAIEGGMSYIEMVKSGMDPQKAAIASDLVGVGSGALELAQLKLLKRLIPGSDKIVSGAIGKAISKVMGDKAVMRAAGNLTGMAAGEASIETLQELWGNIGKVAAQNIRTELDEKDMSAETFEEVQKQLTEGLKETFASTFVAFGGFGVPTAVMNSVPSNGGKNTLIDSNDTTTLVGEDSKEAPTLNEVEGKPTVAKLMGVEGSGVSLSGDTMQTDEQVDEQLTTNETVKKVLAERVTDNGLRQTENKIIQGEANIENLYGFLNDAVEQEDAEGGLQIAMQIQDETAKLSDNYIKMIADSNAKAEMNNEAVNPQDVSVVQAHVQVLEDKARELVVGQTNAVKALRAQQNQEYINLLGTEEGLEKELINSSVESQRTSGKIQKVNNKIITEMKLRKTKGPEQYTQDTPIQKLVDLQIEVGNQSMIDRRNGEPAPVLARNNAMLSWINDRMADRTEADNRELNREEIELELQRSMERQQIAERKAKEEEDARKFGYRQPVDKSRVPQGEADLQPVRKAEEARLAEQRKKEQADVAAKAKAAKAKKLTVAQQRQKYIKKPVPQPSRKAELDEATADKAKRDAAIKRQLKENEDLFADTEMGFRIDAYGEEGTTLPKGKVQVTVTDKKSPAYGATFSVDEGRNLDTQVAAKVQDFAKQKSQIESGTFADIGEKAVNKSKQLFRAAAIKLGGKVYEGNSHIGIIMEHSELEESLIGLDDAGIRTTFEDGFVQHDGTFINREQATKMVGKIDGEVLYSEDFLSDLAKSKEKGTADKAKVLKALTTKTKEAKLARKLQKITSTKVRVITRAEAKKELSPKSYDVFSSSRAVFRTVANEILFNADILSNYDTEGIQSTMLHESLHSVINNQLRKANKVLYRNGMRAIQKWYDFAGIWLTPNVVKNEHIRVQTFAHVMSKAASTVEEVQAALEDGKATVDQLDRALSLFEEALTYPFTDKNVAKYLNGIDAPMRVRAKGKLRTLWDTLVDSLLTGFGIPTKTGTSLNELTEIANTILTLPAPSNLVSDKDVRMAKEFMDSSFDFGDNVNTSTVEDWADELQGKAVNAVDLIVAKDSSEARIALGYEPDKLTKGFWQETSDGRGRIVAIADRFTSQDEFVRFWMHEQVAHQGLRNIFGSQPKLFERFLDDAYSYFLLKEPEALFEIQELYDLGKDKGFGRQLSPKEKRIAAEEMIALRAETLKPATKRGLLKRFKDFLMKWLPKRFVDVKATKALKLTDKDIMGILEVARENVMTGENRFGTMLDKALKARAPQHKFTNWEGVPNFMFTDREYKDMALAVEKKAPNLKKWYSDHTATLKKNFGPDADLFSVLLAVTSPQAPVENNVQFAAETYAYMMGLTDKPGAMYPGVLKKRIDQHWTSADSMLKNLESKNFKVTEFTRALLGDPNATVGDVWMFRLFFGDPAVFNKSAESYSIPMITGLRQKLHDLAAQLTAETGRKWTPREVQAATWVYINAQQTGKDITKIASFQSGFNKPMEKFNGKTPIEWLKSMIPDLHEGPLSQQLGLPKIPLAPKSPLQKKLLQQLTKDDKAKTKEVKTITDINRYVKAQYANKYSPVLTIPEASGVLQEIKDGVRKMYITEDGKAGYSLYGDDIGMVFSNSDQPGVGVTLIAEAIANGGRTLDAFDPFLPKFYKENFGFVETGRDSFNPDFAPPGWEKTAELKDRPDVVYMRLSDEALNLYKNKQGKVTKSLVLQNMGGFSGNYTRETRFSRDIRKPLEDIRDVDFDATTKEFLATANDGQSVTGKIHEWRDQSALNVDRFTNQLEQEFLDKFGGRKPKSTKLFAGSNRLVNTSDTELLQKAMNLWIDSGTGTNRDKAEAYAQKIINKGKKATAGELERLDIVTRMLTLNQEETSWANNNIRHYYDEFFQFAQENELINSYVTDYVRRMWKMPDAWKDANIVWDGHSTSGFKVKPTSGKERTLDSIIDGWNLGMELRHDGVIQNLQSYATELGYVHANRRFMQYMDSLINAEGDGVVIELEDGVKPPAGYVRLDDRGFAMGGMVAYARPDIAAIVNKMGDRAAHKFWDLPIISGIRKINATLKSTLLSISMFHHLAGVRSWSYGVEGSGVKRVRPIKAYRDGLAKIDKQEGFKDPNYKHLGPIVDVLVREGLTLGRTQDWDGDAMMDSAMEEWLRKRTTPGSRMLLEGWQSSRRWKRQWTNGLFGRLFAGLKAEAAATELGVKITKLEKKHGRGLTDAEVKAEAIKVARLINADFGGLHLKRMGRNPDLQKVLQLFLLAPDWTESNWRTVTGMVPGLNRQIAKVVGDNPPPPGMEAVYRKFWGGIAIRGALTVLVAQWAVLALFGDDEDKEEYYTQLQQAVLSREEFAKGRWAAVDLTPIAKRAGMEVPVGKRISFNVLGHFKDILKAMTPVTLAKHKVSPVVRTAESFATRTDWKGDRFKSVGELWEGLSDLDTGLTVEKGKGPRDPEGWFGGMSQLVAAGAYNVRQSLPIPMSELITGLGSESSMLSAAGRAVGVDVRDVRYRDPNEQIFWDKTQQIMQLDRKLEDARTLQDQKLIFEARKDIKEYDNFNRVKSRLGYTKAQLRPINKRIRALELKQEHEGLTSYELLQLRQLRERKAKIYKKFAEIVER